jgi:hypothetical protein
VREALGLAQPEVAGRQMRSEGGGRRPDGLDGRRLAVDGVAVEAVLQEEDQVPAVSAADVEDTTPCVEAAAEDLVEEVDVDVAEPDAQGRARTRRPDPVARRQFAPGAAGISSAGKRGSPSSRMARW